MNLVIDIGNTQVKLALFEERELISRQDCNSNKLLKTLQTLFSENHINKTIVSAVTVIDPEVITYLQNGNEFIVFTESTSIPIENAYATPNTLGNDRLANAIGAFKIFENCNVLSIDLGTCIKFDLTTRKGVYLGGSISPGLNIRFQSLNTFTAQLPLLEKIEEPGLIGTETKTSIQSGVQWGILKEIEGIINEYQKQYSELKVVLTGGDHIHFAKALKNSIFARPNLTLEGLNEVLIFNE